MKIFAFTLVIALIAGCGEIKSADLRSQAAVVDLPNTTTGSADTNPEPIDEGAEERKRLSKQLDDLLASNTDQDAAIEALKKFVTDLQKLLADETAERKKADLSLQGQIDTINQQISNIDAALVSMNSRTNDITGLYQSLRAEFELQKTELGTLRSDLTGARNQIAGQISQINTSITELNEAFATAQADGSADMAALRAELAEKETEFRDMITDLEEQSEQTEAKIALVQDEQVKEALQAEHDFALKIKELADKNHEMIQILASSMVDIDNRLKTAESSISALDASIDEMTSRLTTVEANVDANTKSIRALEQFANASKFCAAASAGLKVLEGDLITMQTNNRTLFGPTASSTFGYGNQFAKFNRFKRAEQLFDQYHWNQFHLNAASLQIKLIQVACSTMITFPGRPTASGETVIVGTTSSPIAGAPSVSWVMPSAVEVRRLMRIIPFEVQGTTSASLGSILSKYQNILATGSQLDAAGWDNHFLALASLVARGMTIVKTSVTHLKNNIVHNNKLTSILPLTERTALCRFGNGAVERSDVAGLRYNSLEDGVINNEAARWHLPQQNFYQKIGNDVYIMEYSYGLAMGPSQDTVRNLFESTSQINESLDAAALLGQVESLNKFDAYPTVLERNVTTGRSKVVANVKSVCSPTRLIRDNFRSAYISRYATIPFAKFSGCWNDMLSETTNLCAHIAYNPAGDATSSVPVPGIAKVVPMTGNTPPWTASEPVALTEHASSGKTIIEIFSESERVRYNSENSFQICGDAARVPFDEPIGPYKVWGNLSSPYSELDPDIYRDVTSNPSMASFIVRSCRKCDSYAYSQPVDIDGVEVTNMKLTFNPDFIFPMNSGEGSRCTLTQSRCTDFCANLGKLTAYNTKNWSGSFIIYGENQSSESAILRSSSVTTGAPWNFDHQAMLNLDQCSCTSSPK
jgi:hypothetical protein